MLWAENEERKRVPGAFIGQPLAGEELDDAAPYGDQAPLKSLKPTGVRRDIMASRQGFATPGEGIGYPAA